MSTPRRRHRPLRRRDAWHARSLHFGPTMTPMVDVVMVILVFFMASAAFVGPEWFLRALVPMKTPPLGAGPAAPALPPVREELALEVGEGGTTRVTGLGLRAGTLDQAERALEAFVHDPSGSLAAQLELLIRPAMGVPYRDVVRLLEAAARLGIVRVGVEGR